ncbi:hypothetical protein BJQ90_03535 [Arthrobacter sp. SO3]|nr:hypothetical protein [Arthrobacter sp. SO3]
MWEWTSDWYQQHDAGDGCCAPVDSRGGNRDASLDPRRAPVPRKVVKGGSFLCADSYCQRYRPAARRPQMIDTGMSHIGFRCAAPWLRQAFTTDERKPYGVKRFTIGIVG